MFFANRLWYLWLLILYYFFLVLYYFIMVLYYFKKWKRSCWIICGLASVTRLFLMRLNLLIIVWCCWINGNRKYPHNLQTRGQAADFSSFTKKKKKRLMTATGYVTSANLWAKLCFITMACYNLTMCDVHIQYQVEFQWAAFIETSLKANSVNSKATPTIYAITEYRQRSKGKERAGSLEERNVVETSRKLLICIIW